MIFDELNKYDFKYEKEEYDDWLNKSQREYSIATKEGYKNNVKRYFLAFETVNKKNLLEYKGSLIDNDAPAKTINARILGISNYITFIAEKYKNPLINQLKLKTVKVQRKNFLDKVISLAEYQYLLKCLKKENEIKWYFMIKFMANTGVRVSELVQVKYEHIEQGFFDIYGKGKKQRRIFIPKKLKSELLEYAQIKGIDGGFLASRSFCTRQWKKDKISGSQKFIYEGDKNIFYSEPITTRSIAHRLKEFALKFKLNKDVIYPHSFRHLYAKQFLKKRCDLALLADLLGHDNIETTRIYLRLTSGEMQDIVDEVVDW